MYLILRWIRRKIMKSRIGIVVVCIVVVLALSRPGFARW